MRRVITGIAAMASVLALSSALGAHSVQTSKASEHKVEKAAGTTGAASAVKETSHTGAIVKYDSATKSLSLKGKRSEFTFTLADDAAITEGTKKLTASDLTGLAGQNAKVYYTMAGDKMTAHKIQIVQAAPKPERSESKHEAAPVKK
jgi:hypothetical protein